MLTKQRHNRLYDIIWHFILKLLLKIELLIHSISKRLKIYKIIAYYTSRIIL